MLVMIVRVMGLLMAGGALFLGGGVLLDRKWFEQIFLVSDQTLLLLAGLGLIVGGILNFIDQFTYLSTALFTMAAFITVASLMAYFVPELCFPHADEPVVEYGVVLFNIIMWTFALAQKHAYD